MVSSSDAVNACLARQQSKQQQPHCQPVCKPVRNPVHEDRWRSCRHQVASVNVAHLSCADDRAGILAPAGTLLSTLWQAQPPLVSEFVSQRNLPSLLKLAARMGSSSSSHCLVALTLVHRVWSFTASLVSEPLLLQAIPAIVQCCGQVEIAAGSKPSADDWKLQADIQVGCCTSNCSAQPGIACQHLSVLPTLADSWLAMQVSLDGC